MPDITMCLGASDDGLTFCRFMARCYRHTATADMYSQSYFAVPPFKYHELGMECDSFWDNRKMGGYRPRGGKKCSTHSSKQ